MKKRDLVHLRKKLETKLAELRAAAHHEVRDRASQSSRTDGDGPGDEGDDAQRLIDEDNRMLLSDRDSGLVRQVVAALERMADGTYGKCVECGLDIEIERLRAVPWAIRCTADQEAFEFEGRDKSPTL